MTWIQKYRIKAYLASCMWIGAAFAILAAMVARRLVFEIGARTAWAPMTFDEEGARALTGIVAGAMLTFVVFVLSMLLLAVQIASSQLTPRIIAGAFRTAAIHRSMSYFVFAFAFAAGTQGRAGPNVPELAVFCTMLLGVIGLIVVFHAVDYIGNSLRPVSVVSKVACLGIKVIETVYPKPWVESQPSQETRYDDSQRKAPARVVPYPGKGGVFLAFDAAGLAKIAAESDCLIENVPTVGDFVAKDDAMFRLYGDSSGITDKQLHLHVAMGAERTAQQDPGFVFRVIVDIAIRALSPAVNDPTTAVMSIDQIHRLLLKLGRRDLGDGTVRDSTGQLRLVFPTPNWEDFVALGVAEIRLCSGVGIQVLRRLRAMLDQLVEALPPHRHAPLREQLLLLDEAVNQNFSSEWDRKAARDADYQGLGGVRATKRL